EVTGVGFQVKRILKAFMGPGLLAALVCFVSSEALHAKQATAASDLSGQRRASALRYPQLPKEIQERFAGNRKLEVRPAKADGVVVSKDWGSLNIGFFAIFAANAQPLAPAKTETCSQEIVVAVVDTGIDYTHPELKENIWVNRGETGRWDPPRGTTGPLASC